MADSFDRLKTALADRYAIQEELGAGGMATVYLAEDLKHKRKVAVKVLRPELAATLGPERFLREIEVAANLTHPHILPLFDSGDADGFLYYVMPYIEGESLRAKLAREGELPIAEAVKILREVVDALVRLTSGQAVEQSPTWTPDGESLLFVSNRDGKRDIHRPRVGKSGAPIGETNRLTTDLDAHTITLSQDGQRLVYSALTFRANVWAVAIPTGGSVSVSAAQPVTSENQVVEGVGISRDGRWLAFDSDRSGNQDIFKMPAGGGEVQQLTTHASNDFRPVWSPDGSEIAFYSLRSGTRDIYVMSADAGTLQRVTDAPGQERYPDWSPGGERLVFTGDGSILVVSRDDDGTRWGEPRKIADGGIVPRWSPDGNSIAYRASPGSGAYIVASDGGDPRLLEQSALFVGWSLDSGTLYFTSTDGIWSVPVGGGTARILVRFDDPSRRPRNLEFDTDGRRFFFMIEENESDISVLELLRN